MKAVFLGAVPKKTTLDEDTANPCCRFQINGVLYRLPVSAARDFALLNCLQIGRTYEIRILNGLVSAVCPCDALPPAPAPFSGYVPGLRTLKNLLATAMTPLGQALYVYGGGWNWQDTGAGPQAVSIGLAPEWFAFFQAQVLRYSYRDFYPAYGRNSYYFAGLDCSGYLGWAVYNTLHEASCLPGYVGPAQEMARDFARRGWGRLTEDAGSFCPGDVCSITGHVWLCVGTCGDGSILLAHSTPTESRLDCPGGGVQLSALSPSDSDSCAALALAESVMKRHCPVWYRRYAPVRKPYAVYTDFSGGVFRWAFEDGGVLTDPDDFAALGAEEIVKRLFGGL